MECRDGIITEEVAAAAVVAAASNGNGDGCYKGERGIGIGSAAGFCRSSPVWEGGGEGAAVVAFMVEFVVWVRGLFWAYVVDTIAVLFEGVIVEVVVGFGFVMMIPVVMAMVMA
ncbi:hypothetical protein HOY80DRAFT_392710 [Tuber brumale]|nr:hypothetical protein HOY80DRAFT_392710 [Tuber brumale]